MHASVHKIYDFNSIFNSLNNKEIKHSSFMCEILETFFGTFAHTAAQQYVQTNDMYVLVALFQEENTFDDIDWKLLFSDDVFTEFENWPLPKIHTSMPRRIPQQISGMYKFWWSIFRDVFCARYFNTSLPFEEQINILMEDSGLPLYTTTSNTWPEMLGIYRSIAEYRDNPITNVETPAQLIKRCIKFHLIKELYWQFQRRYRSKIDRHALDLRTNILSAFTTPIPSRTLYDKFFVLFHNELENSHDSEIHLLHKRIVDAYNDNYPRHAINFIHK